MTDIFAICDGCSKKYRVPSVERTYACKSCTGTVRPLGQAAPPAPVHATAIKGGPEVRRHKGPGFFTKLAGALAFWKRPEESDELSASITLDSMDWDVFGADPLDASEDPMKQPSLLRAGAPAQETEQQDPWRDGATAPRMPARDDHSPQESPDSVRSAFNDFDWD
ncbi:hypothetical protein Poly30_01070 [Planctomycetes bacterium Poly30]|uniref:Uncharacterized protein n=1 Tax=Saltatorellus ferox TaxID=2528018 RepID=A0A518EKK7_9BACT|nr:hypothetical protein Poly30_01070 [Planctomycetes bacterium Poly30]